MIKIGLSGKARSGKNTVNDFIIDTVRKIYNSYYDFNYYSDAFANPIKEIIMDMFPEAQRQALFGSSKNRAKEIPGLLLDGKPVTYRKLCLDIGEYAKKYKKSVWIDVINNRLEEYIDSPGYELITITDIRFRDEFDYLKSKGFYLIRIKRNFHMKSSHISEIEQESIKDEEFDAIIENNGSKKDLRLKVFDIINNINDG